MNTEGPDDTFDGALFDAGGGDFKDPNCTCEVIDFAAVRAKARGLGRKAVDLSARNDLALSLGLRMEDFVLSAPSLDDLGAIFDRVRGVLHFGGWQGFQPETENNVSRPRFSATDDSFYLPESPVSRLDKFQLPELVLRNGKGRWPAIGFWPELLGGGEENVVDVLNPKFTIVGRPGYLRWVNGTWYMGSSMDQCGPVSVWTAVFPDKVSYSR